MEEKIKELLAEHGLTIDQLTEQEIEQLKEEINAMESGATILDGFFSNPELYYRRRKE